MKTGTSTILNEWDLLAERFNTYKIKEKVDPDAAVNVYVGWPTFIQQIYNQSDFLGKKNLDILDFGCGAGELCKIMHSLGHHVTGADNSQSMRDLARAHLPESVKVACSTELLNEELQEEHKHSQDVITSMHVFDWIENLERVLIRLSGVLRKDGIILFAVFPKKHVIDSLKIKDLFEDFDSVENPYSGYANFDGVKVPVYVREASFYDDIFRRMNFDKVLEYYPPYPKVFLEKYHWKGSHYPEMAIYAYRKL